jgi:hypothetical protein
MQSPRCEKAKVMLLIFSDCFPSTVSELIQDTEAAHGMVFRSLMVMGGLCGLMTDFSQLSPSPAREITTTTAYLVGALHVLRRLMMAAAVGFCFAPASGRDHGVERIRDVKKGAEGEWEGNISIIVDDRPYQYHR